MPATGPSAGQSMEPPTEPIPVAALDRGRRRRRAAVTMGLVALPVVGSAFVLPAIANAQTGTPPPAVSTPGTDPTEAALQAYFDAGYTFDDAVAIAERWQADVDVFQLKVKAGRFLGSGTPLAASSLANPTFDDGLSDQQLVDAFFAFGYTAADAELLAQRWGVDPGQAKTKAGRELKTVGALPFVDAVPATAGLDAAFGAYFAAGYDYDDAVLLAAHWGLGTPADAKLKAGGLLRDGQPIPAVDGVAN